VKKEIKTDGTNKKIVCMEFDDVGRVWVVCEDSIRVLSILPFYLFYSFVFCFLKKKAHLIIAL